MNSRILSSLALTILTTSSFAATFQLNGNYRMGSQFFDNLDTQPGGNVAGSGGTSFLEHRFLLRPDIAIDDRFMIHSEWNIFQSKNPDHPEALGAPLDSWLDYGFGQTLDVRRAWLQWNSDYGILRFGRQPKAWGLGIYQNAGLHWQNDFGTTADRVGYEAMIGGLRLNFGYEKPSELNLNKDADDVDGYEGTVEYSTPDQLFTVGMLYARIVRAPQSNVYGLSSHDFSVFVKKKWEPQFQVATEATNISQERRTGALGFLLQLDYVPSAWSWGFDFAYASANHDAFYTFHPNYKPFLILYNQSMGKDIPVHQVRGGRNGMGVGSAVGLGNGKGAWMEKLSTAYTFENSKNVLGFDLGYSRLAYKGSNESASLGFEFDSHFTHNVYDNFQMFYGLGTLFPGKGFGTDAQFAWGLQVRGAVSF